MVSQISVFEMINTRDCRFALAIALDCSEVTIRTYIKRKSDNLTKAAALEVISKYTGLTKEQILDEALQPA